MQRQLEYHVSATSRQAGGFMNIEDFTDWERFCGATYEDDCRWFKLADSRLTCTLAPFSGQLYLME